MELSRDTANLLRPHQVEEAKEELQQLEATLNAPPHIRTRISDIGQMRGRRDNLKRELERSTPRAFGTDERDAAISEFKALEKKIQEGMPSSEEMRRNPPGAVGKQLAWTRAQNENVMRYKNLALRLHKGGDLPANLKFEGDIANIERLRPLTTSRQLAMDGAQIPKTADYHFGADVAGTVLFSDQEMAVMAEKAPAIAAKLATMTNDERAQVKGLLAAVMAPQPAAEAGKSDKPNLRDLTYNMMKKIAAANGINCKAVTRQQLINDLRAHDLIE